ncbi:unnamed protein product [Orchesella dallaii]|uniref:Death domain-containing protein n=1 Tax=Orchesella dallaii TaxID=48710 RepID=A0ABP1RAZ0_9HEXA
MAGRKCPPENRDESSSVDIGQLVVGDEPCTFVQVRGVLNRSASAAKLWPKLIDIALSLNLPTNSIISLETRIATKTITYPGALLEILEAWRGVFSTEAKLQTLINVLERNDLADCADSLRIHYNEFEDAYVVATLGKLKSTAKSSTWENLPDHLKLWMNSKPVKFQGNKKKLEELTAQNTPLHVAVKHLELLDSTTQLFSAAKVDFNGVNKYNNTALHRAVLSQRSATTLDALIKAGADEKARGQYNRTVLHLAARIGNLTALKFFILRGHDVNVADAKGATPLHLAVALSKTNLHEMVVLLVEKGADVSAINNQQQTPIDIANGRSTLVETRTKEFLIQQGEQCKGSNLKMYLRQACTFVEVRDVLCRCASSAKLRPKLLDIARSLKIPSDSISLEREMQNDTITYSGALLKILKAWGEKFSAEAKLHTLIDVLEINGLTKCADDLRMHFDDELKSKNILPEHLKAWMNNRIAKFKRNEVKHDFKELNSKLEIHVRETISEPPAIATHHAESKKPGGKNILVGDELCPYGEVVNVIHGHSSDGELLLKLKDIEISLQLPINHLDDSRIHFKTDTCRTRLYNILGSWRSRFAANATLQTLIKALESNELNDCAG